MKQYLIAQIFICNGCYNKAVRLISRKKCSQVPVSLELDRQELVRFKKETSIATPGDDVADVLVLHKITVVKGYN